ncbi:ATP-binding protein [Chloroflexus sp.]|uniref:sensor histidine kinase n=1 Tax=Chloroflexus sp. TaxID=1904827 RepID=UPI00298EEFA3|nr:ATP-binding protein [Chloroflexus sp.]MDW8403352.1 ATP-binding protein [Chloroflexus sp.]
MADINETLPQTTITSSAPDQPPAAPAARRLWWPRLRRELIAVPFRVRLTLLYTSLFSLALLVIGIGVHFAVAQALYAGVQRDLTSATQQVRAILNAVGLQSIRTPSGELQLYLDRDFIQLFTNRNIGAQFFRIDGTLASSTPNLEPYMLPLPAEALQLTPADTNGLSLVREINGVPVKSLITPVVLRDGQLLGFLQVSRPLDDVVDTLTLLQQILIGGGLVALIINGLGAMYLSKRALRPIEQITLTAQSIVRAEDLGRRIPEPAQRDEIHQLTVTINELLSRLEQLFSTQQRFVADVSHELRTPLTAMQGNLEVLDRGTCTDPGLLKEVIGDMRRETARLIRMVNDLLLLAQSETHVALRCEPVELDTLLLEVFRELRPLAGQVRLRIGAEDQILVYGDRDRIKQALLNLGVNALQYTPPGGLVVLGLERYEQFACLSVADTGIGISEAERAHIFDRFYRVDRSRSRHSGGAGLGLSIVKWVAEAHRGYVTVASEVGRGSTFAIYLPLPASAAPAAE